MLFNLAQAHRLLKESVPACEYYARFLDRADGDGADQQTARLRIPDLECDEPPAEQKTTLPPPPIESVPPVTTPPAERVDDPVPPVTTPRAEAADATYDPIVTWSLAGATVLSGSAATVFAVRAASAEGEVESAGRWSDELERIQARGRADANAALGFGIASGVLMTLTLSWHFTREESAPATNSLSLHGTQLSWTTLF